MHFPELLPGNLRRGRLAHRKHNGGCRRSLVTGDGGMLYCRTPEMAQTFDYARANAYVALGRADEAVAMLTRRERELPDSYEPPARLARVLFKSGRLPEALR